MSQCHSLTQQLEGIEASGGEDDGTSEGTLTPAVSFTRTQGDSDNALASDRSVSPNDSGNALAARNTDTSRSSSPTANPAAASEDGQDTGIMLKIFIPIQLSPVINKCALYRYSKVVGSLSVCVCKA